MEVTERETNNSTKLPGDYQVIDFNGDGKITSDDKAPYQYNKYTSEHFQYNKSVAEMERSKHYSSFMV